MVFLGGVVKYLFSNMMVIKRNKCCMIIFFMKLGFKNWLSYFVNLKFGWLRFVWFYDLLCLIVIDYCGW